MMAGFDERKHFAVPKTLGHRENRTKKFAGHP